MHGPYSIILGGRAPRPPGSTPLHVTELCSRVCSSRELDSKPINKLTDDMRSFVFDGAVRSVPVYLRIGNFDAITC